MVNGNVAVCKQQQKIMAYTMCFQGGSYQTLVVYFWLWFLYDQKSFCVHAIKCIIISKCMTVVPDSGHNVKAYWGNSDFFKAMQWISKQMVWK